MSDNKEDDVTVGEVNLKTIGPIMEEIVRGIVAGGHESDSEWVIAVAAVGWVLMETNGIDPKFAGNREAVESMADGFMEAMKKRYG